MSAALTIESIALDEIVRGLCGLRFGRRRLRLLPKESKGHVRLLTLGPAARWWDATCVVKIRLLQDAEVFVGVGIPEIEDGTTVIRCDYVQRRVIPLAEPMVFDKINEFGAATSFRSWASRCASRRRGLRR